MSYKERGADMGAIYSQRSATVSNHVQMISEEKKESIEVPGGSMDGSTYMKVLEKLRGGSVKDATEISLLQQCVAEAVGTGIIVITGVGVVNSAVFTAAQSGLWQVAVVWGFGVTLAILTTAAVSGAHLNPAVSLAFALLRPEDFPPRKLLPYWLAQILGGIIASAINLAIYGTVIDAYEARLGITRGSPESELSAMAFGEYFPNPEFKFAKNIDVNDTSALLQPKDSLGWSPNTISAFGSFGIEAWGTAILMFVILAVTDDRNTTMKQKDMAPFFIGFTVAVLISLYAPLNQAGFNPARDFGPRIVAAFAGWGEVAIPGPQGGFWTYILGPLFGAPIGGAVYDFVIRPPKFEAADSLV